jgi:phenylpropionate dioxygenase-like ring-hydroxylating dioxygenase large terminal subunit
MATTEERLEPGTARAAGRSVNDAIRDDPRAGWPLNEESYHYLGSEDLAKERYYSKEFHDLEVEKMWKRVWQMACRVEDIPDVGDSVVYDISSISLIVVRVETDTIKAYYNSCLHRGTALVDSDSHLNEIRCPFHGFCWSIDGSLAQMPSGWDFPHVQADKFGLPEVRVGTWAGFVFINLDPKAPSLENYVGGLAQHNAAFAYPWEKRYKAVHAAKVIPCNWKVGMEAFLESYHIAMTHGLKEGAFQYDIYEDQPTFNRMVGGSIVIGPPISGENAEAVRRKDELNRERWFETTSPEDPWGCFGHVVDAEERRVISAAAKGGREGLAEMTGDDVSAISDSELNMFYEYFLFPNLVPWFGTLGYSGDLCYRFRPNGDDPDSAIMEVMYLYPFGKKGHPRAARLRWLQPGEPWSHVREFGPIGLILDQDDDNFARIQKGLHTGGKEGVTLADYQEVRIRHIHQTLDTYLEGKAK